MQPKYLSVYRLEENVPYKVTEIHDSGRRILLRLYNYKYPNRLFETFLLHPGLVEASREALKFIRLKNGKEASIHIKFYGWAPSVDGATL
jgi:hypothetical protein